MAAGQVLLERLASAVVPSVLPIVSAAVAAAVPHAAPRGASAGAAPPHAGSAGRRHAPAPAAAPHAPAAGYYSREMAEKVSGEKAFDTDAIQLSDSQRFLALRDLGRTRSKLPRAIIEVVGASGGARRRAAAAAP
eukprot:TRINITY_DN4587_c0_g1_i7.p2 TRINITY_DN4587_c0_g1~~TRINITY_DN4587_c0_g1_i7.p2  ORF type:complete len:135 (+),score=25.14 TRINITY_DN4587_c0_g1_i7:81-485(+)